MALFCPAEGESADGSKLHPSVIVSHAARSALPPGTNVTPFADNVHTQLHSSWSGAAVVRSDTLLPCAHEKDVIASKARAHCAVSGIEHYPRPPSHASFEQKRP